MTKIDECGAIGQYNAAQVAKFEEKNLELAAKVHALELAQQERTSRLEAALEELEAFSFSVSHDLRAPLRGIAGFVKALQEDHGPRLDAEGIKYGSRRAAPLIEVADWSEAGWNTYSVKDNGVGFDPQEAHRLFGVFQRLHSQQEFEGTGIGLAIAQRIVRRHGGKVRAEGKVGAGATFYFTLPAPEAPQDDRVV